MPQRSSGLTGEMSRPSGAVERSWLNPCRSQRSRRVLTRTGWCSAAPSRGLGAQTSPRTVASVALQPLLDALVLTVAGDWYQSWRFGRRHAFLAATEAGRLPSRKSSLHRRAKDAAVPSQPEDGVGVFAACAGVTVAHDVSTALACFVVAFWAADLGSNPFSIGTSGR